MADSLLILTGVLFTVSIGAAIEYYRQLRRVRKEYIEAKEVVEDIVISFNRQLEREAEKLERVKYKINTAASESSKALRKVEKVKNWVEKLKPEVSTDLKDKKEIQLKLNRIEKKIRDTITSQKKLNRIEKKIRDTITSQKKISDKVEKLEERTKRHTKDSETKVESAIPIKREKALAPLTETELSVLKILASEGTKTAPQVRDRIKMSREHTARLMKKLYEEGYLERDTSTIPFKYWIKKEMKKILKKTGMIG